MNIRTIFCCCTLLILAAGYLVGQPSLGGQPTVEDTVGVNVHFDDPNFPQAGEMQMIVDGGFRWIRTDLKWDKTEGAAGYDFSYYDRLLKEFERFGVRTIFILCYRNPIWKKGGSFSSESERQAFAKWASAVVGHFKGRGVYWEIYNEPNNEMFWEPKPNADDYAKLAAETAYAIKAAAPGETIIGPATSTIDLEFIERGFRSGLLSQFSAISVHPYRHSNPETVIPEYSDLRSLIEKFKPPGRSIPIISGEWGYSATWKDVREVAQGRKFDFNEELQGKFLARQMLVNVMSGVRVSIWYDWSNDYLLDDEDERNFGVVGSPYNPNARHVFPIKPAYTAAQTLASTLKGYRFAERLSLGSTADYVLKFTDGISTRIAAWTTSKAHNLVIPVSGVRYKVIDWKGRSLQDRAGGSTGIMVSLTDAPIYLVPSVAGRARHSPSLAAKP